ncbi:ABC transporter permease [Streptomyces sp. A7024]|uniref:Transport permease protein n=1 Tax=Streptomyces coryli TaxID=1128680 RepID=A0A6G4U594_9ACTN|nr:ABC transporter permease [Streptomyces coryli]NGN66886.1 ABC transporter permease [Streptomyces coryli]
MSNALTMTGRSVRLSARTPDALITALVMPVMLMCVFVYFFGGAIETGGEYVQYVVPGVLILCAGFGAGNTAMAVASDMHNGIIDRFRSMDVGGRAILAGHVAASLARNLAATAVVFGVAMAIGFRPQASAAGWLAAIGVLVCYIIALSWLAAAVGLVAKSPEAAGGFTFFIAFLPYPSSGFVPVDTMPSWLRGFAEHQPVTPVIESMRKLLLDQPVGGSGWQAVAWCAGIAVVAVAASGALFRRRTS